jgi:hypothetical protein
VTSLLVKSALHTVEHLGTLLLIVKQFILLASGVTRTMRLAGYVAQMGEKRNAYRILVGKPKGKRPLGRLRCRWVDNIKMYL